MLRKITKLLMALAFLGLLSCQKAYVPDTPDSVSVTTQPGAAKSSQAGTQCVTIMATSDWRVSTTADWVDVYPASGSKGIHEVSLSYTENTSAQQRSAEVVFSSKGNSETYLLVQKGTI